MPAPRQEGPPPARADLGGVLNYNIFAASDGHFTSSTFGFSGASTTLDARAFSSLGTMSQSVIVRTTGFGPAESVRLDTAFTYSDQQRLITYRAGDTITGGFAWTRPVRIGGIQVERNFGLRPDLVTMPLASTNGSAAVPSTVDVYVNNLKTYSQIVASGPFSITNIPVVTGAGDARVVLRDAAGHETQTSFSFYASPSLLKPGLFDFSFEAGVPRVGYGTSLDAYVDKPVASASWRQGVFDWLTLESHAEAGGGLANGGLGAIVRTWGFGVLSLSAAGSRYGESKGVQGYASYEARFGPVTVNASSQMTLGPYDDLASMTGRLQTGGSTHTIFDVLQYETSSAAAPLSSSFSLGFAPPKMVNRISIGSSLWFDSGSVSASYIDLLAATRDRSKILTASYSRPLPWDANLSATIFTDFGSQKSTGFFVGLSVPLGGNVTASSAASGGSDGKNMVATVEKPLGLDPGSVGWRAGASQGSPEQQYGAVSYRSSAGWAESTVNHTSQGTNTTVQFDGAVATQGGGVFLTSRIDDSFAVVETGVPGVGVLYENRPAGVTDANGRLLVPGLRSYQSNRIAIDPRRLPVDADVTTTQGVIAPANRAGVRVDFGIRTHVDAAVLVLSTPDGRPLVAGSHGRIEGKEAFVVGYAAAPMSRGCRTTTRWWSRPPRGRVGPRSTTPRGRTSRSSSRSCAADEMATRRPLPYDECMLGRRS